MGLFSGARERRGVWNSTPPTIPPNSANGLLRAHDPINLGRTDAAMQSVAVWASVNLIATLVEMMPGSVYRGTGPSRTKVATPRWLDDLGGSGHGTSDFAWQLIYCWGLRGNAVGQVGERDPRTGQPTLINLAHPDDVRVWTDPQSQQPTWYIRGVEVPTDQIWHKRVFPIPGRVLGASPIAMHALTVGAGMAAQQFAAQFFLDGATPAGILFNENQQRVDPSVAATIKARFMAATRGNREPAVLGQGWKYQAISIAPNEAQFLETQEYSAADCARIYGPGMPEILGYKTGGSMTYTNISQRAVDLLKYTLDPWFARYEAAMSALLPAPQYYEIDRNALLRTDLLTRMQAHALTLRWALAPVNEIREQEGWGPVPWGNEPYLPSFGPTAAAAALNDATTGPDQPTDAGGTQ